MDLYFKRHDGHAVTCDDFLAAMADANNVNLDTLSRWYRQAGTPNLHVATAYDAATKTYTLTCKQHTPASPGEDSKLAVLIPIKLGLLGPDGEWLGVCVGGWLLNGFLGGEEVGRMRMHVSDMGWQGLSHLESEAI